MLNIKLVLFLQFFAICLAAKCTDDPVLHTKAGKIRGVCRSLNDKENIYAWLSIPYAKPPTGDLRFRPPSLPTPWSNTLDTTKISDFCFNLANRSNMTNSDFLNSLLSTKAIQLSEDCLYLSIFMSENVFTNLGSASAPILVYFQNGNQNFFNPTSLVLKSDIILITIQYRLDVFGFLHLKDNAEKEQVEGNQAILDQHMALKWINENAENFGGNASKITLFGSYDAAMFIGYQMMYKPSSSLFRNVILNSGTPVNLGKNSITSGLATNRARMFLKEFLKCKSGNLIQCARRMSGLELVAASRSFLFNKMSHGHRLTRDFLHAAFSPVVDEDGFTQSSIRAFRVGNFKKCNMMVGFKTYDSFSLVPYDFGLRNETKWNGKVTHKHTLDFEHLVDSVKKFYHFYPLHPFNNSEIIYNSILNQYTRLTERSHNGSPLLRDNYYKIFHRIVNDESFACPTFKLIDSVAKYAKVYVYVNSVSDIKPPAWLNMTDKWFNTTANATFNPSVEFLDRWISFVKYDSPNDPNADNSSSLTWPAYTSPSIEQDENESEENNDLNSTGLLRDSMYLYFRANGIKVNKMASQLKACDLWNTLIPANLDVLGKIFLILPININANK